MRDFTRFHTHDHERTRGAKAGCRVTTGSGGRALRRGERRRADDLDPAILTSGGLDASHVDDPAGGGPVLERLASTEVEGLAAPWGVQTEQPGRVRQHQKRAGHPAEPRPCRRHRCGARRRRGA